MLTEEGQQAIDLPTASGDEHDTMFVSQPFQQAEGLAEGGASDAQSDARRRLAGECRSRRP